MSWTTPRTWVNSEVVTAAIMNAHVRDNSLIIKVTRSAAGRLIALSSATVADLAATNVTGLARPGAANDFTAGTTKHAGTSRVVVPVGADKYADLGGGNRAGLWVEGDYLHHVGSNQTTEYRYLGEYVSTPAGAVAGSVWVEGTYLHYVDADGDERRCAASSTGHGDSAALPGSAWVETYVHWIRETGTTEQPGHNDVAHSDGSAHGDSHSDAAHSDSHSDVGHSDSHGDVSHEDVHEDYHEDVAHGDSHDDHQDGPAHLDSHTDDSHGDVAHTDSHSDTGHTDTHSDVAHDDSHGDSHSDDHGDHDDHADSVHLDQPTVV